MSDKKPKKSLRQIKTEQAIEEIMASENGRLFIYGLLERSGLFQSSAGIANFKTNETFFYEGRRNEGLRLQADIISVAPHGYSIMLNEHKEVQDDER